MKRFNVRPSFLFAIFLIGLCLNVTWPQFRPIVSAFAQNVACYRAQGGTSWVAGSGCTWSVASGGALTVDSGGTLTASSGSTANIAGTFQIGGTAVTATATELNDIMLALDIADLSAEATYYVVSPQAGTISKITSVIDGAVATADVTLTCSGPGGAMTGGVVTIATASSAAGDVDTATPSTNNVLTAAQSVSCVVTGGGAGGTPRGHVVFTLSR